MDGYSVQDAASVLGVAEGRVWELLARGVLSGTPEGDSMRVFLKAEPRLTTSARRDESPRTNGNGGSHAPEGEASAFRELLTEFRNLTERYGQALLALGEARGEVAGLRSRVELLEARLDLRLPPSLDPGPVAWESAAPSAPVPEPPAPAGVEPIMPSPAPVSRTVRQRKTRSTRAAVAGFADALARAQDPSVTDVGGALATKAEVGTAPTPVASPGLEIVPEAPLAPEPEPAEAERAVADLAEAEAMQAETAPPDASASTYSTAVVEPDWFADGDFAWLDAADMEARGGTDVIASAPAEAPAPVEVAPERGPEPQPVPAYEPMADSELEVESVAEFDVPAQPTLEPEPEPAVALEPERGPEPAVAFEPEPEPEPAVAVEPEPEPLVAVERFDAVEAGRPDEEAIMWLGDDREAALAMEAQGEKEIASTEMPAERDLAPPGWNVVEPDAWPATDTELPLTEPPPPPLTMTEAELAQLARDEGWDEAEVAAIRAMISRPADRTVELPGGTELDEAMAALDAVPVHPEVGAEPPRQWTKPITDSGAASPYDDWAFEAEPAPPATNIAQPPMAPRRPASDPNWLRQRRGPAASAYRRLRRLFPG